jgi:hypothetical protein
MRRERLLDVAKNKAKTILRMWQTNCISQLGVSPNE